METTFDITGIFHSFADSKIEINNNKFLTIMITSDQLKDLLEREQALRRYL